MNITGWLGYACVRLYKPFSRGAINKFLKGQVERIRDENAAQSSEIKILNVGSGGEIFSIINRNGGFKIEQVDIDPGRNPDIVADVSDMHMIADSTYDYVFAMEVLEHTPTPQSAVDEIFRVLKVDGEFIFSTPFVFPIHDEPHDYYRYTKYGLHYLLREFGFRDVRPRSTYIQSIVLLLLRTIVIGSKGKRLASMFIYAATIVTYPLWMVLSFVFDSELATTGYFGVARKIVVK